MKNLDISATENTLEIHFDATSGILSMEGVSYPEDAMLVFSPLNQWLESYIDEIGGKLVLNLKLNYLNSSSTKCMLDFIQKLENYYATGADVKINWYYEEDDEDIMEMGEEFAEDSDVPFHLIPY